MQNWKIVWEVYVYSSKANSLWSSFSVHWLCHPSLFLKRGKTIFLPKKIGWSKWLNIMCSSPSLNEFLLVNVLLAALCQHICTTILVVLISVCVFLSSNSFEQKNNRKTQNPTTTLFSSISFAAGVCCSPTRRLNKIPGWTIAQLLAVVLCPQWLAVVESSWGTIWPLPFGLNVPVRICCFCLCSLWVLSAGKVWGCFSYFLAALSVGHITFSYF